MSSPKVYLEELAVRKAELSSRIEMMENHLAGKDTETVGSWRDTKDVTEQDIASLKAELSHVDEEIERVSAGRPADPIANAIRVARIATGEDKD